MTEATGQYPRRRGGQALRSGPAIQVIAMQEIRKASRDLLFQLGFIVAAFLAANAVFNLIGDEFHTMDQLIQAIQAAIWAGVAVVAGLAGPALVDDMRKGALELYMTHGVSKREYVLGKVAAVFGLAFATTALSAFAYYIATLVLFNDHPDNYGLVPLGILAVALIWGLLVAGIGLAIASLTQSTRVSILIYVGGFLMIGIVIPMLLVEITNKTTELWIMSPANAMLSQAVWAFGYDPEIGFPLWWGMIALVGWIVVSWGIVLAKRPRVHGEEAADGS